jgi:hypothetical protein
MPTAVPLLVRLVVVAHKRLVGPQGSRSSEYMIRRYTSRRQRFESLGLMSDAVYTTVRWETDIVRLTRFVTRWCGRWHVIDRRRQLRQRERALLVDITALRHSQTSLGKDRRPSLQTECQRLRSDATKTR